jgi:hypothetical protein
MAEIIRKCPVVPRGTIMIEEYFRTANSGEKTEPDDSDSDDAECSIIDDNVALKALPVGSLSDFMMMVCI